jgi:ribose 5-phosphate isomerase RpiB
MEMVDLANGPEFVKIGTSAIFGGIAFKIVERFLNSKYYVNEQQTLRAELRKELDAVKLEVIDLRKEVDEWRDKYYHQVELTTTLQAELTMLRCDLDEYKGRSDTYEVPDTTKDD